MAEKDSKIISVKSTWNLWKVATLKIDQDELVYEFREWGTKKRQVIPKEELTGLRYGVQWLKFEIAYGREYQIFLRTKRNKVIKLPFRSYFQRKAQATFDQYVQVYELLWKNYFQDMAIGYLERFNRGESFKIGEVSFTREFLELPVNLVFGKKEVKIEWNHVEKKDFRTYFTVFSNQDPEKINRGFSYHSDWDAWLLISLITSICSNRKQS